jgi:hypothetical protein
MAAAKTVTVNYTPAQTAEMVAAYVAAPSADTVALFAEKFGKGIKSIVAKLSREGVYVAKEYKGKNGETPVKKDAHADAIGKILNLTEPETESLTKANKTALVKVFGHLANSVPLEAETPDEVSGKGVSLDILARVAGLNEADAKSLSRVRGSVLAKLAAVFADEVVTK